ncbi:sugar transferase [Lentibacillus sp. N15]|uniref:sugar transferase n=1 Tax=Lentibacillus songyuanensis TaxID=3136161 RepID=UPI0031BA2EBF
MELRQNARTYTASRITKYAIVKRIMDMIVSLFALILLAPVALIVYLLLYKTSGTPCLIREARIGRANRVFTMWTFRTTTLPSRVIRALPPHPFPKSWKNGVPDSFTYLVNNRTRTTKIGAFLHKHKLDKLPQFINVLKGDMSLVGPQPELPEIADYYNTVQQKRLLIRPGMTGYAQVHGLVQEERHGQKITDDLYYLRNYSFQFDMKILMYALVNRKPH